MNFIHIAGHLGADPEVRFTSNGKKVTTLRVAAKARRSGKDETIWWRVTVWGEDFDKMIAHLKKGSSIIAIGELNKPEIYTDREGRPQVSMGITASSLMFSPFGRTDSNRQEEPAFAGSNFEQKQNTNSGMEMQGSYSPEGMGVDSGMGEQTVSTDTNSFEDVPF